MPVHWKDQGDVMMRSTHTEGYGMVPECASLRRQFQKRDCWDRPLKEDGPIAQEIAGGISEVEGTVRWDDLEGLSFKNEALSNMHRDGLNKAITVTNESSCVVVSIGVFNIYFRKYEKGLVVCC